MFCDSTIITINTALAYIALNRDALRLSTAPGCSGALATVHIRCERIAAQYVQTVSGRGGRCAVGTKRTPAYYEATCDLGNGLDCWAQGSNPAAAFRNLFKALRAKVAVNDPRIIVPLVLSHPTEAAKQARAERKAQRDAAWQADLDRAVTAVEAEREAATTVIGPAPELRAVDSHDDSLHMRVGGYSRFVCNNLAPRFVEAPIVPADAAPGSEGIFKALLGLRTEQKIVALVNALHAAGVTIHRAEEDGCPIIRASMPDYHPEFGTLTVLNL
jgi:hypothetical protein